MKVETRSIPCHYFYHCRKYQIKSLSFKSQHVNGELLTFSFAQNQFSAAPGHGLVNEIEMGEADLVRCELQARGKPSGFQRFAALLLAKPRPLHSRRRNALNLIGQGPQPA